MNKKIMVVDDDPTFLTIMNLMLKRITGNSSVQIEMYSDPCVALKEIQLIKPDLLFLDLFMPNCNGWDFLNEIKDYESNPTTFMLSSSVDKNDIQRAKEFNLVQDFISKPISFDRLQVVLSN